MVGLNKYILFNLRIHNYKNTYTLATFTTLFIVSDNFLQKKKKISTI